MLRLGLKIDLRGINDDMDDIAHPKFDKTITHQQIIYDQSEKDESSQESRTR